MRRAAVCRTVGAKLEAEPKLFNDVFYKGDPKLMGPSPVVLSRERSGRFGATLKEYRPFLVKFTGATNLTSLFSMICTQFRTAKRETNAETNRSSKPAGAGANVKQASDSLRRPGTPPAPGITALSAGDEAEQQMYITFGGGRIYLVTAQAPTRT